MNNFILKNNGFKIVSNVFEILNGKGSRREDIPENPNTNDIVYFRYAPKCPSMSNKVFHPTNIY